MGKKETYSIERKHKKIRTFYADYENNKFKETKCNSRN